MPNAEVTSFHTGILRLTLAVPESREYWRSMDPTLKGTPQLERAFNERWFGPKSMARVKLLLNAFALRFAAYPSALERLRNLQAEQPQTRALICHWHVQLSDPLYRRFTGEFLVERRERSAALPDPATVTRWIESLPNGTWAPATVRQFATKLTRTAREAGLLGSPERAELRPPVVPDEALDYLARLLASATYEGNLLENPYLRSVGLDRDEAADRLRRLPTVRFRRMGDLFELDFEDARSAP